MVDFKRGVPVIVTPDKDPVTVDTIEGVKPKPGKYKFSLVVVDESGAESAPAEVIVTVLKITAVLVAVNSDNSPFQNNSIPADASFKLSAGKSAIDGGKIKEFKITYTDTAGTGHGFITGGGG